jgi:hypothetical protein
LQWKKSPVADYTLESMSLDRIPLIIGVTGHRELHPEDVSRVQSGLREFFENLQRRFPHTPLLLLSSMCQGADRLAARIAIETPGVSLAVVLPWPEGQCEEERCRGGDRAEFDALMVNADHTISLPLPDGVNAEELGVVPAKRQECFEAVSRYITRHCQVLVAIWNGVESDQSQTWQVIQWHVNGTEAPFAAGLTHLDNPETGPLHHLPVRRGGDALPPAAGSRNHDPRPAVWDDKVFLQLVGNFDRFNADVLTLGSKLEKGMATSCSYVFSEDEQKALPKHLRYLLSRFALADQLAILWQKKSRHILLAILGIILVTVASFESYAHVAPDNVALLVAYAFLMGAGLGFIWWTRKKRYYNRYLDDRALAEAMRVHLFWKLAEVRESASDYYLRTYRSQLDWIRAALRSWSVQSGEHDCGCSTTEDHAVSLTGLEQVRTHWMMSQLEYFEGATVRDHARAHRCHVWIKCLLGTSTAAIVFQSARLLFANAHHQHLGHDHLTHWLIIVIAMGGVLAGLCHEYAEKCLFEKQSRSYAWMAALYRTALSRFDALVKDGKVKEARDLIRELGGEALAENADWVIYHREHEPQMRTH